MSEEVKEKLSLNSVLLLLSTIGVLFTITAYIIGMASYIGKAYGYGISPSSFEVTAQTYYLEAYYYIVMKTSISWMAVLYMVLIFACSILFWLFLRRYDFISDTDAKKLQAFVPNIRKNKVNKEYQLGEGTVFYFSISYLLIIFILFWIVWPAFAYLQSKEMAEESVKEFLIHGCATEEGELWSNCSTYKNAQGAVIYEGILIGQSKSSISFLTSKGAIVTDKKEGYVVEKKIVNLTEEK